MIFHASIPADDPEREIEILDRPRQRPVGVHPVERPDLARQAGHVTVAGDPALGDQLRERAGRAARYLGTGED